MKTYAIVACLVVSFACHAQGLGALAESLEGIGKKCHDLASEYGSANKSELFKAELDEKLESQRMRNDVDVYSVGHGRQQTTQYMLSRMQQQAEAAANASSQRAAVFEQRAKEVESCTVSAAAEGKALYASRPAKAKTASASDLMSAWLVNIESVTSQWPDGRDESRQVWEREKSRAELDSL
jgi:hypothetical protein